MKRIVVAVALALAIGPTAAPAAAAGDAGSVAGPEASGSCTPGSLDLQRCLLLLHAQACEVGGEVTGHPCR